MNERIRLLWRQAVLNNTKTPMNFQDAADEFARLIVAECLVVINQSNGVGDDDVIKISKDVEKHFGEKL